MIVNLLVDLKKALAPITENLNILLEVAFLCEGMKIPTDIRLYVLGSWPRQYEHGYHVEDGVKRFLIFNLD